MIDRLSQSSRLLIACAISAIIIGLWDAFFVSPMREEYETEQKLAKKHAYVQHEESNIDLKKSYVSKEETIRKGYIKNTRIKVENEKVLGSINLLGAKFDDLTLKNYKKTLDKNSENVTLLSPASTEERYFFELGWLANEGHVLDLPTSETVWLPEALPDANNRKINLVWTNSAGIKFIIEAELDDQFMLTIKQKVINSSSEKISIRTFATINRIAQNGADNTIVHEGPIAVVNEKLEELSLSTLDEEREIKLNTNINWLGFSDKYWLTAIIPSKQDIQRAGFKSYEKYKEHRHQAGIISNPKTINPREVAQTEIKLFAGAKELEILDLYEKSMGVKLFDRAVDFGILYFITKPIFELLHYFYNYLGNFGLAILLLTVLMKLILFPLAHKGFKGMNRLKELQPKMNQLKEKYADNPSAFQQALLELYKKEKVNPMSGCLPILLQIPIFFALYKVLYVSIEMRHAPFYGWIHDLSAADPTNVFTLFGLVKWDPPSFLCVGILPIIMALTMYFQQKLNPEPADPSQAMVMKVLPWVFLFMFASFPSGLIIYWAWSNVLSIAQQLLIKKLEKRPLKKA